MVVGCVAVTVAVRKAVKDGRVPETVGNNADVVLVIGAVDEIALETVVAVVLVDVVDDVLVAVGAIRVNDELDLLEVVNEADMTI